MPHSTVSTCILSRPLIQCLFLLKQCLPSSWHYKEVSMRRSPSKYGPSTSVSSRPIKLLLNHGWCYGCSLNCTHYYSLQRARLLDNTESMERMGRKVDNSFQICVETEEIGGQILNDLHSQREQINKSRSRVSYKGGNSNYYPIL